MPVSVESVSRYGVPESVFLLAAPLAIGGNEKVLRPESNFLIERGTRHSILSVGLKVIMHQTLTQP